MSKEYINPSNETPSARLGTIAVWFLVLEHFHAPQWLYGAWVAFSIIIIASAIYRTITEIGVDVVKR